MGFLVLGAIATVLIVGAIVALVVQLIPYILLAAVILVAVHASHRRALPPRAAAAPPPVGWGSAPPSGWVLMPVWVGSPPRWRHPPVIDAEVIEDERGG